MYKKGAGWGEVGCMSACCGFMFVVNLCSLPLSYFVRVFLFFFLCLSFHPALFRCFFKTCFWTSIAMIS